MEQKLVFDPKLWNGKDVGDNSRFWKLADILEIHPPGTVDEAAETATVRFHHDGRVSKGHFTLHMREVVDIAGPVLPLLLTCPSTIAQGRSDRCGYFSNPPRCTGVDGCSMMVELTQLGTGEKCLVSEDELREHYNLPPDTL